MKTDTVGNPIFEFKDLFEMMHTEKYQGMPDVECELATEIERFNRVMARMNRPQLKVHRKTKWTVEDFDTQQQSIWFMPREYQDMDLSVWLLNKCTTDEEKHRVHLELDKYDDRGMMPILKLMKFLVDTMRQNNVVYGVGRGSSVASFVLYLIGVHRINSLEFDLDFSEFMRN